MAKRINKGRVLEVATDRLLAGGPENVVIELVGDEAGASVGIIYKHWKSKTGLLAAVVLNSVKPHSMDPASWLEGEPRMAEALAVIALSLSSAKPGAIPGSVAEELFQLLGLQYLHGEDWPRALGDMLARRIRDACHKYRPANTQQLFEAVEELEAEHA